MRETVLVIDDDEKITSMLRRGLAFEGYGVRTARNGAEGLEAIRQEEPDVIVLDIMMPGVDGWEVCRRLREAGSRVPVLMLTAKDEVSDRVRGLDAGADDYLVKPFALEELLARVRALLRRSAVPRADEAALDRRLVFEDLTLDPDTREAVRGGRSIELTAKEYELLHFFLSNPRRVLSRDVLMDKIWGYDYSGESNVLEVYVAMLRNKLEEAGEKRLIQTVRGAGYVLRGDKG
ncbi:response regulator transcription factor [Paenibacillus antri]|uniref:Response regulator transcription factor n=1 Tax=Paenibacillus antri TaxID=2582848 RepID=A0A5R9GFP8_9BACL|nr:response regulator transcription factor [Paenibacillus antri]TLS51523.1 response regulator transcription factor [Paenibacillus antri]